MILKYLTILDSGRIILVKEEESMIGLIEISI